MQHHDIFAIIGKIKMKLILIENHLRLSEKSITLDHIERTQTLLVELKKLSNEI